MGHPRRERFEALSDQMGQLYARAARSIPRQPIKRFGHGLLGTRGAQAYCLECPVPMARATAAPQLTLWQRAALMAGLSR